MDKKQDFFLKLDLVSFVRGTRERSGWLGSLETLWNIFLSCFSKISLWIFEVHFRLKRRSRKHWLLLMSYARKSRHYTRKSVPRGSFPLRLLLLRMFLWCLLQIPARNINSGLTLSLLSPRSTFSHHLLKEMYKWGNKIGSIIIFHLSKLWKARFFILCDAIFLVRLQEKFEIDHLKLGVKGLISIIHLRRSVLKSKLNFSRFHVLEFEPALCRGLLGKLKQS